MKIFKGTDVAFVTGAGSGIGRATCQLLAEQGATVVAADINKKSADDTVLGLPGKNHMSVYLDVTKKDEVEAAIAEVVTKYSSPPNIAVNSAGRLLFESLLDLTEEKYNQCFDTNVKGTVWVTQAVCRKLVEAKKKGTIVNLSSIDRKGFPLASIYAASKGAVESFSTSTAKEFGPHGIRVNIVCPGLIDTPMVAHLSQDILKFHTEQVPLKRSGKPEEVAEVIAFLAGDNSSYVNGASLVMDGGYS